MIKYIFIIISAFFFTSCQLQVALNEEQKNADAVYLSLKEEYNLKQNGKQEYLYSSRMMLQTHASFNRFFGDSHINYDPRFQKMKVLKAETENSMGKSVVKENAINDILPKGAEKSAYYNRLRTRVISHMGTEIGAVINFDYIIDSNEDYKPGLFENIIIGKDIPVKEYVLKISIPKGKKLNFELLNSDILPIEENTENGIIYTWKFTNLSAVSYEAGEPAYRNDLIRLIFSTVTERECMDFISNNTALNYSDDTTIVDVSKELIKGVKSELNKVLKLQKEIKNNIAFNDISFRQASYRGRDSKRLWNDLGANTFEKTVLLKDMLNAAGISADVVVAIPEELMKFANINPDVWKEFYVYVDSLYNGILIKATEENLYSRHLDLEGYRLCNPISGKIIDVSLEKNTVGADVNININSRKKLWGDAEVKSSGLCFHNLVEDNEKYIKGLFGSALKYKEIENGKYVYSLEDNSYMLDDSYFYISLPEYRAGFNSYNIHPLSDSRNAPLKIKGPLNEKYTYSVNYNKKFRLINKPTEVNKRNKLGQVIIKISDSSNKVIIEKRLEIEKSLITKEDYVYLKELIDLWTAENYKRLYFTQTN